MVVFVAMLFAKHFGFQQACEELHIQELISKAGVETLAVGILPRTARRNEYGLETTFLDPLPYRLGDELRTVIRSDKLRDSALLD